MTRNFNLTSSQRISNTELFRSILSRKTNLIWPRSPVLKNSKKISEWDSIKRLRTTSLLWTNFRTRSSSNKRDKFSYKLKKIWSKSSQRAFKICSKSKMISPESAARKRKKWRAWSFPSTKETAPWSSRASASKSSWEPKTSRSRDSVTSWKPSGWKVSRMRPNWGPKFKSFPQKSKNSRKSMKFVSKA